MLRDPLLSCLERAVADVEATAEMLVRLLLLIEACAGVPACNEEEE